MNFMQIKFIFKLALFFSFVFFCNAKLKEVNIRIISNNKYLHDYSVEIKRYNINPYYQNYIDLGLIKKIKVDNKINFNASLNDTDIYYINIKPYNLSEIFIPKYVDSINGELYIDSNGVAVFNLNFKDSINSLHRDFVKWQYESFLPQKSEELQNFISYKEDLKTQSRNFENRKEFLSHNLNNFIDTSTFEILYYFKLLQFMKQNVTQIDSVYLAETVGEIDDFIDDYKSTQFNNDYLLSLIDRLIDFKIILFSNRKLSHLEKFRLKNEYIRYYPDNLQTFLFYRHFIYSVSIYYDNNYPEKLKDISLEITNLHSKEDIDTNDLNYLSDIYFKLKDHKNIFDFSFPVDTAGSIISENIYKNKVVIVIFWTSWCPHCKEIMESTNELLNKYNEKDFTIITISLDGRIYNWINAIQKYNSKNNYISIGSDANQYSKDYFINGVPRCFLLDRDQNIIDSNLPFPFPDGLVKQIENLIE